MVDQEAQLVHDIYAAALEERPWQDVLWDMVRLFDASSAQMVTTFVPVSEGGISIFLGLQAGIVQRYLREVAEVDVWYHELLRRYGHLPTGFIYKSQDLISDKAQQSSRFFADYLRPLEIGHNLGVMVGDGSSDDLPVLPMCLYRPAGAPTFTAEDDARLQRLQTHFTRAMRVRNRMRAAAMGNAAIALDKVATATVVLSRDRRILLANPAAEKFLKQSLVPLVSAGRLCATEPPNTTALEQSLAACQCYQFDSRFSRSIRLSGSPGNGIVLRLAPPLTATPKGSQAAAVGFLTMEGRPAHDLQTLVTTLYKLTPSEAALVKVLSDGLTPEAFADQRGVALATVKTQLQSVFSKTGTRRQSDLMRLAYSIAQ